MLRRWWLALPSAAVAGCVVAIVTALYVIPDAVKPAAPLRPIACDDPSGVGIERAGSVAAIFVLSTVVTVNGRTPECSFDLVTPAMRKGKDRAAWKARNPVAPFPIDYEDTFDSGLADDVQPIYRDPAGEECVPPARGCWLREVRALLYLSGARKRTLVTELFEIRLVLRGGWRVDYWGPVAAGGEGPARVSE